MFSSLDNSEHRCANRGQNGTLTGVDSFHITFNNASEKVHGGQRHTVYDTRYTPFDFSWAISGSKFKHGLLGQGEIAPLVVINAPSNVFEPPIIAAVTLGATIVRKVKHHELRRIKFFIQPGRIGCIYRAIVYISVQIPIAGGVVQRVAGDEAPLGGVVEAVGDLPDGGFAV